MITSIEMLYTPDGASSEPKKLCLDYLVLYALSVDWFLFLPFFFFFFFRLLLFGLFNIIIIIIIIIIIVVGGIKRQVTGSCSVLGYGGVFL